MTSPEIRYLGSGWARLLNNIGVHLPNIPPEGVSLAEFEEAFLSEVFIPHRPAILAALKRKGVVFPVRDGLAIRVFAEPPVDRRFEARADPTADGFLRVVAPHMARLGRVMTIGDALGSDESRVRQREAVKGISTLLRRHLERGGNLPAIRAAMFDAFRPETVAVLARYEAAFDPSSAIQSFELVEPERRLPPGLPPHEKILAILQGAGGRGMWKADIRMRFQHPRPKAAEINAMLDEIEGEGMIASARMRLARDRKPGIRYFHSDHGLPRLADGVAIFPETDEDDDVDTSQYRI